MLPRGKIDVGWSDLLFGMGQCLRPRDRDEAQRRVEAAWSCAGDALACLSVRSGFDALLAALAYPPGSEVLMSALTIRDMVRIVEHHGLVPIPIDLDVETLSITPEGLERAAGPRTKALVVAHVFGSRMPLDDVIACARRHGLLVVEDCAQTYVGSGYPGHPDADVCMFSFGPIKTNTALGGGILRIKDAALLAKTRAIQERYPVQSRWRYLRRLGQYAGIKLVSIPVLFGLFATVCRRMGRTHDQVISSAVRGFPGPDFFTRIRHQPSAPLLALLERRLTRFDPARIERRIAVAKRAIALMPGIPRPGERARAHFHWVFPIQSACPDQLMERLWSAGFDATRGASSLTVVPPPRDRPELAATQAQQAMQRVLYLPVYSGVRDRDLQKLARVVTSLALHVDNAPING